MVLEVRNAQAGYGRTPVLQDLSVSFPAGRMTALIGPNGSGKSTLLRVAMGFMALSSGEVVLGGRPAAAIPRREFARQVAYLPQENHCPDYMTLGELIELAGYARYSLLGGPAERDRTLFREALATVGLADLAGRRVSTLSGGQKQRAFIAMVLAQDAPIILMDEPVNHLDIRHQYSVLGLARDLTRHHGKTVIAVLHDLNLACAFADEVVMLRDGRITATGPVTTTVTSENVSRTFDLETEIFMRNGRMICVPQAADAWPVAV